MSNEGLDVTDQRGWHLGPPPRDPKTEQDRLYLSARAAHARALLGPDEDEIRTTREAMYVAFLGTSWCRQMYPNWARPKQCGRRGCTRDAEAWGARENGQAFYEAVCEEHRCHGTNADGRRCRKQAMRGLPVCAAHRDADTVLSSDGSVTLAIHAVPDTVIAGLEARAAEAGQELQDYLLDLLAHDASAASNRRVLAELAEWTTGTGATADDALQSLHAARDERS